VNVAVNGVRLFFDVDGSKLAPAGSWLSERPTVVLLHAGPGGDDTPDKDLVGPELAKVAQVVYLDQRGTGRSDRSDRSRWTLDQWADDVRGFCDVLEIERPIVLGSSIGALTAVRLASRHPELASKLVLVSVVARYVHTRSVDAFERLGGAEAGEVAARYFADPTEASFAEFMRVCVPLATRAGVPSHVAAWRTEMNLELAVHWQRTEVATLDLREEAARVVCPVLLLAGEDDPSFPPPGAEELRDALPHELVRFVRVPAAGHGVFRDAPHMLEVVRDFVLEEPEPDGVIPAPRE
jgi:pimeloyl-ACP methyl ester carboxylesterase